MAFILTGTLYPLSSALLVTPAAVDIQGSQSSLLLVTPAAVDIEGIWLSRVPDGDSSLRL